MNVLSLFKRSKLIRFSVLFVESFDFLANLSKKTLVCDLIYKPDPTVFLTKARQNGNATMSGIHMLIWQAFYAFEKFCGILPTQADKEQIMNLLV